MEDSRSLLDQTKQEINCYGCQQPNFTNSAPMFTMNLSGGKPQHLLDRLLVAHHKDRPTFLLFSYPDRNFTKKGIRRDRNFPHYNHNASVIWPQMSSVNWKEDSRILKTPTSAVEGAPQPAYVVVFLLEDQRPMDSARAPLARTGMAVRLEDCPAEVLRRHLEALASTALNIHREKDHSVVLRLARRVSSIMEG
jgi:hypothetical protein